MISEGEFKEWLQHPVTRAMRELLEQKRDQLRRQWESGAFSDYEKDAVVLTNVANLGTCKGFAFVQELEYDDFLTEIDDGKPVGAEASGSGSAG